MKLCHCHPARRALGQSVALFLGVFFAAVGGRPALAAEKTRLRVDDYQINVQLLPESHKLVAQATVKVTALENLSVAVFQLNNSLRITKLTDADNRPLAPERNTQESTVRFELNNEVSKNASAMVDRARFPSSNRAASVKALEFAEIVSASFLAGIFTISNDGS